MAKEGGGQPISMGVVLGAQLSRLSGTTPLKWLNQGLMGELGTLWRVSLKGSTT